MSDDWAELKRLFQDACDRPPSDWPAVVAGVRARDPELGDRLAALLRAHDLSDSFLESPTSTLDILVDDDPGPRLAPGLRLGPYEIIALLGAGGMGEVYHARDERLGRDVAIKILPADLARDVSRHQRMAQEARAAGMLNHPNILTVYDVGIHEGSPFIVSELLEGQTLRATLEEAVGDGADGLAVDEACRIVGEMAQGLGAAHQRGIVHRDLKPENVFVTREGRVKILDFGIAKLTHADDADFSTHTVTGAVLGTVGYMAPEQIRGQRVGPAADVFAAGAILYELVSGNRAFDGVNTADRIGSILANEPTPLASGTPGAIVAVIARCLAKPADARYQSGAELAAALAAAADGGRPLAWMRWPGARRRIAAVVACLAVLSALAGAWLWRPNAPSTPTSVGRAPSLVLLPTRVFGAPDVAFLEDAVPSSLSTYLAQIEGLITSVPPTADEVARVGGDLNRIARAYDATTCVLTTVTAQGTRLMLAVQLVDPQSKRVVWSGQYDGSRETYLQLLQTAARGVQRELLPSAPSKTFATATRSTNEAELAFRTAQYFDRRYNATGDPAFFDATTKAFQEVLERDPRHADAAAQLSFMYMNRYQFGQLDRARAATSMKQWAQRAIDIDITSGAGWAALASAEVLEARPDADRILRLALKAAAYGPRCAGCQGTLSTALAGSAITLQSAANEDAFRLDPLEPIHSGNRALGLMAMGRSAEAVAAIAETRALDPEGPWGVAQQAIILADNGEVGRARPLLQHARRRGA